MVMADQEQTKNDVASAWEIRVQAENVQSSMDGHANDAGDEQQQEQLLLSTLSRVLVQWALRDATSAASGGCADVNVSFSGGLTDCVQNDNETLVLQQSNELSDKEYETLFAFLLVDATKGYGEWVEMVPWTGRVLGRLPRSLVHTINVLHRGIGMFVTKDVAMIRQHGHEHGGDAEEDDAGIRDASHHQDDALSQYSYPDLYVHRRTDSKRIFPSLYDMFIGGVSLAGKASEATARREVAEELGLVQALHCNDAGSDALSEPLLDCVVCTSHNRCFVTLYSYAMDMSVESVTWQEEEVAWGAFMPYPIIVASADLSIQRLAERMQWPGGYPPIQSSMKGSLPTAFQDVTEAGRSNHAFEDPHDDVNINTNVNANVDAADGVIEVAAEEDGEDAQAASGWGSWDYVPDGLNGVGTRAEFAVT
uniref:Nudix hydrolase domain-containing protein n=1 Tax=Craspedostauros australis TaxID=1486917 RepID=A0A7S0F6I1_9STRA